ncbi:hypothetical protein M434DRAFT_36163 [Hypoxylon sp. CO27-5]|nr:hypothetical protein M434DRAFT_36163 [Hypoxylon sp. CO27-5]
MNSRSNTKVTAADRQNLEFIQQLHRREPALSAPQLIERLKEHTGQQPSNDGCYQLAEGLLYCGDEIDALSAFSLPLPPFTLSLKGDIISWVLESKSEQERTLIDKLALTFEELGSEGTLEDQMKSALHHIESVLHYISDNESEGQDVDIPIHQGMIDTDTDGINETSISRASTTSSFAKSDLDNGPNETLESKRSCEVEMQATYERIRSRINQWLSAYKFGGRRWCDVCDTMWDLKHAMNHCKYCYNADFCDVCLNKLKAGKLEMPSLETYCNKGHNWLRLPPWDKDTYFRALRKEVYVRGHVDNEGRDIVEMTVPVAEWLNGLRKRWATRIK